MMSKEREISILYDYITGIKTTEIVSKHKVSTSSIAKLLKKYNITNKNSEASDSALSIYNEIEIIKAPISAVSKRHNCSESEIKQTVRIKRNEFIIADYVSGMKIDDICSKYNLSNMAIYKILNANKVERNHIREKKKNIQARHLTDTEKTEIINEYLDSTTSIKNILENFNISKYQLYQILYEANCTTRNSTHFTEKEQQQIIKDFRDGNTITELSRKYKASRTLISYVLKGDK